MAATKQYFVVDGSNLATEGRTTPSLAQLQDSVKAFRKEYPSGSMTVVVDASFPHRIDASEHAAFERSEVGGELVSPPAGASGRGDGFLLQIADRTGATVVSNDSFQEFHGEYAWLFDVSRLIGGKPVPGVGWIFSLRSPVRGPKSRKSVRDSGRDQKTGDMPPMPKPTKPPKKAAAAIAAATADALSPRRRRPRRRKGPSPEAINDPAPFLQFLIDHRLGATVEGTVEEFASHGAFVATGGVRAYIPLAAMGEPPPTRARDVLEKGEPRSFVVQAVDAPRRAIELALPEFAHLAAAASDETVEAVTTPARNAARRATTAKKTATRAAKARATAATKAGSSAAAMRAGARKGAAKKGSARKKTAKTATTTAAAQNASTRKKTTKTATTRATPAKKTTTTSVNQATSKRTPARNPAKKTGARKTPAKPATKKPAIKKTSRSKSSR